MKDQQGNGMFLIDDYLHVTQKLFDHIGKAYLINGKRFEK